MTVTLQQPRATHIALTRALSPVSGVSRGGTGRAPPPGTFPARERGTSVAERVHLEGGDSHLAGRRRAREEEGEEEEAEEEEEGAEGEQALGPPTRKKRMTPGLGPKP